LSKYFPLHHAHVKDPHLDPVEPALSHARPPTPTPEPDALYAIREVADQTGLSTETLRIWERRYGRPEPVRLPSGHRRYTDAHVRWLRHVAEALARGHRPHEVVPLDEAGLYRLLAQARPDAAPDETWAAWLDLVRGFAGPPLRERLLRAYRARAPLAFLEEILTPLLHAIGSAWAEGTLDVSHEHFASEVIEDIVRHLRGGFATTSQSPRVVLATLAGESHALGVQMAALLCAARGVPHAVIGRDTPREDLAATVRHLRPAVVALGVSLATGGVATDRELAALRKDLPEATRLVVGGPGARGTRRGPRGVEYVENLAAWDALVAAL
jgi:methylmalonyl-CoA mutase cobalamin-binding subunit